MNSDLPAIRARRLRKVYRLYDSPLQRMLDVFGLAGARAGGREHAALDGVDLEIRGGEKVAIIGRNGAGKSTLLRLISGVMQPTSGTLEVRGGAQALLQIGSGFHPDFTGRQNVVSYLAHLGLSGREAESRVGEIVEFAELEEYIDQPIKTYSTGMVARLMFATSTVVAPQLLVLDEILGVGDAYFARKSFERIRDLCAGAGTTLLLVSHDIYAASRLCDRMIWLDAGRVVVDDASPVVMKAYEHSIRVQEEERLARKRQLRLAALARSNQGGQPVFVELFSRGNLPLAGPAHFARIAVRCAGADHEADLRDDALAQEHGCWGALGTVEGVECREMRDYGSPFRRVSAPLRIPAGALASPDTEVVVRYRSEADVNLGMTVLAEGARLSLGDLPQSRGRWVEHSVRLAQAQAEHADIARDAVTSIHGTGDLFVTGLRLRDVSGAETLRPRHGEPVSLEIDYEIRRPGFAGAADLLVGFHRDGVSDACKFFTTGLAFDEAASRSGTITMGVDRLPLANGAYTISITLAKAGYYASDPKVYFSINPDVYACLSRFLEIEVHGGDLVAAGPGVVAQASWTMTRGDARGAGEGA